MCSVSRNCITDVWSGNLDEEMDAISTIIDQFPVISMDTEFPGVVVTPLAASENSCKAWLTICSNVNLLKPIQLGLTFTDAQGNRPPGVSTWQFHFHFDLDTDMHAPDSIEFLERAGVDFDRHSAEGIDLAAFGELMISSGLVLNEQVRWVAFHAGSDFGYLLKALTSSELPEEEELFFDLLKCWFGRICDLKVLLKGFHVDHRAGLSQIASDFQVQRVGPAHQAGSDALLTSALFFTILPQLHTADPYTNVLYGLGADEGELRLQAGGLAPGRR
eukprot:NODE_3735_length_911_cov_23.623724_g3583_i0.p1 GENE.NODE_3735_length_911_cov_23.623724_g3583_i0~~NODE_3735_length_911_cov_23.623724_g3583_i0.p1  ORF type:complete len:283 (+),score=91.80 NODE_3735_length_911_cov_23.623724_g3583_i0:27-851(+)